MGNKVVTAAVMRSNRTSKTSIYIRAGYVLIWYKTTNTLHHLQAVKKKLQRETYTVGEMCNITGRTEHIIA